MFNDIDVRPDIEDVKDSIAEAIDDLYALPEVRESIHESHTEDTPLRIADSMLEMIEGCWQDPEECLSTTFENGNYDEIVYVNSIRFVSVCAHHHLPFFGKANFGYLPDNKIVGLSKIPRLVEIYSKRPQVQEKLTCDIVDTFMKVINPKGCGLVMEAYHLCLNIRGVENESAWTKTTALRGSFREGHTKEEFLHGTTSTSQIWP